MANYNMLLALATFAALCCGVTLAQNPWHCDNTNAIERQNNPIGTCACEGHLWIAPGCQEGFFCYNSTGYGCSLVRS